MKKLEFNILQIVLNVLVFIFFITFVYFSYFTAKELLVLKYISPENYSYKFYTWELEQCSNPYSYEFQNYYSSEVKINNSLSYEEKQLEIERNNKKVMDKCFDELNKKSENKKVADFKYDFIKYSLATLFSLILFLVFSLQNLTFYRKK